MSLLSRRSGLAALTVAVGAVLVTVWRGRSAPDLQPTPAVRPSGETGSTSTATAPTAVPRLPPAPVLGSAALEIEIEGAGRPSITSAELAEHPTTLQANNRRAWRLTELIDSSYLRSNTVIHALTIDGGDYVISDDGGQGGDAIIVRRDNGELYIGWLDGEMTEGRALADAERPAQRIEHLARISVTTPVARPALPAASLAIIVDGKLRRTVTAQSFAAAATIQIKGQRDGAAPAIDVAHAFGAAQLVGLTSDGAHLTTAPPRRGARAVIYLTPRARFKFAWVDATGEPIAESKLREVSELELRTGANVATRN